MTIFGSFVGIVLINLINWETILELLFHVSFILKAVRSGVRNRFYGWLLVERDKDRFLVFKLKLPNYQIDGNVIINFINRGHLFFSGKRKNASGFSPSINAMDDLFSLSVSLR